jgi:hypothetical protein
METSLEDKLDKCAVEGLFGGGEERMLWRVQRMERRSKFVQENCVGRPRERHKFRATLQGDSGWRFIGVHH